MAIAEGTETRTKTTKITSAGNSHIFISKLLGVNGKKPGRGNPGFHTEASMLQITVGGYGSVMRNHKYQHARY